MNDILPAIQTHLRKGGRLQLFLDYDGTLVPIARTPEEAQPDAALLDLLTRLAQLKSIQVAIISGRPLASLRAMLPITGITLVGIYGIEIMSAQGFMTQRTLTIHIRPIIEKVKSEWLELVANRNGFLVEDKGLAVALHARFADPQERSVVIPSAEVIARTLTHPNNFRILGDVDFLEVAPLLANKGKTIEWLLDQATSSDELVVYFGDDDKDEEAFEVVQRKGGYTIQVGNRYQLRNVSARLASTENVRQWLDAFVNSK